MRFPAPRSATARVAARRDHEVQLYETDEELCESVSAYVAVGLREGQSVIVLATPAHREAIAARLERGCVDVERAGRTRRLVMLDAAAMLAEVTHDGVPDPVRFRARIGGLIDEAVAVVGGAGVRAYGEMVDLAWQAGNRTGAILLEELWNELADTRPFELLCAYRRADFHGGDDLSIRHVYATHTHVSHIIPAAEHFRLLVDSVKDYAIFMLDPTGRIVSWNAGAERVYGYPASEIIGEHFSRFYPEAVVRTGKCDRELDDAVREGRFEELGWRVRKGGTQYWANVVITPVHDDDGRFIGFAKVTRDLTERKVAEEQLMREQMALARETGARQRAEQAVRFSEMFVGMLGHDLRNPLSAIATGAQLVMRLATDDRQRRPAARIVSSAERMARMIDQLLDFTRIRLGGGIELAPSGVNLASLTEQIVEETEAALGCNIDLTAVGDMRGLWDGDRLAQVLSNLLANAAQHGAEGRTIDVRLDGSEPAEVRFTVHNHGRIPDEILPSVFEPFRGGNYHRSAARGLGLGMYITREIVRAHGGAIDVSSTEAEGTTFMVRLPRQTGTTR